MVVSTHPHFYYSLRPQLSDSVASHSAPADCKSSLLGCVATDTQAHLQKVSPASFISPVFLTLEISKPAGSILNGAAQIWVFSTTLLFSQLLQMKGSNRKLQRGRNLKPGLISAGNWPFERNLFLPLPWPSFSLLYNEVVKWRDYVDCFWVWYSGNHAKENSCEGTDLGDLIHL